ncbi:TIM44-like domain-containing protein [Patulibacter americanus]|uniref:TIM44-like domain-containing protein n=1 Tax=Patulibacter americanus TaxID=588672 RepID=UPI0003B7AF31|nr:TIM44-like domain-containing protein [Patulibacter americanus]
MRPTVVSPVPLLATLLAQAGGGSSGFSGGGGGGGGGSLSGSGSSGDGEISSGGYVIVLIIVLGMAALALYRVWKRRKADQARTARDEQVRLAAAEAAQDDALFDPDSVVAEARDLFLAVQEAWDTRDRAAMAHLLGPDLLEEWRRRLDDFDKKGWHSRVVVKGDPGVRLIGLVNRAADEDDRIVVFVACDIHSWVITEDGKKRFRDGNDGPELALQQYWTLGRTDDEWILLSIEEEAEGHHHLHGELIAVPSADPTLAGRSRTELAVADAAGPAAEIAQLTSTTFSRDAHVAALDLSLVDDRFSPDVLTVAVEGVVAAWTEAIDGDDAALERRASPEAVGALLYGDDATRTVRTVVRGLQVRTVTIGTLDGQSAPPAMGVVVAYRGAWYREDRDTQAVRDGSRDRVVSREERWTLALTDDRETPWVLVGAAPG